MSYRKFSYLAKLLHWGFVLLFLYGLLKQIDSLNQLEELSLLKFEVIFATVFLLLLAIRFFYMKETQQSSLPEQTPESQKLAAKIVHTGMYICLAAIPLSGLMIGLLFWLDLKDGILINIVIEAHEFSVSIIFSPAFLPLILGISLFKKLLTASKPSFWFKTFSQNK